MKWIRFPPNDILEEVKRELPLSQKLLQMKERSFQLEFKIGQPWVTLGGTCENHGIVQVIPLARTMDIHKR